MRGVVLPLALGALLVARGARAEPCVEAAAPNVEPPSHVVCQAVTPGPGTPETRRIEPWPSDLPRGFSGSTEDAAKARADAIESRKGRKQALVGTGVVAMALGGGVLGGAINDLARSRPRTGYLGYLGADMDAVAVSIGATLLSGGAAMLIVGFALPSEPGHKGALASVSLGPGAVRLSVAF